MARGDLFKIIKDIQAKLTAEKRAEVDAYEHIFEVDGDDIAKQIRIQLVEFRLAGREQNKVALTPVYRKDRDYNQALAALDTTLAGQDAKDIAFAKKEGHNFAAKMKVSIKAAGAVSKVYRVEELPGGTESKYRLRIANIPGTTETRSKFGKMTDSVSVFDFVRDSGISEQRDYTRRMINNHLGANQKVTLKEKLFDLGHLTAVSAFKLSKATIDLRRTLGQNTEVIKALVGVEVLSQFTQLGNPDLSKVFEGRVAHVKVESKSFNSLQSTYEAAALQKLNLALKKVLADNKDWVNQGGSDSLATAIAKELMNTAKSRGAKVKVYGRQTKAITKAQKDVAVGLKVQTTRIKNSLGQVVPDSVRPQQASPVSMQNLIPMLNQKLPELVKQNMGSQGRLRNRTGRFAESVEVVSISGDGLNIGFTYQTDPYAVFEGQGNRDPRSLIDLSIRQAAAGIMSTRFSTGRVR